MKAAKIFAILLLAAPTAAEIKAQRYQGDDANLPQTGGTAEWKRQQHYHGAKDPCVNMQKQPCLDSGVCVYMKGDRWDRKDGRISLGRKSGRYSGTKRYRNKEIITIESCALEHMFERTKASKSEKKKLEELGFGTSWDTMKCEEAFFLKDCKDMNQNLKDTKCAWHCDTGCTDYTGDEHRVYMECGWDAKQVAAAAAAAAAAAPAEKTFCLTTEGSGSAFDCSSGGVTTGLTMVDKSDEVECADDGCTKEKCCQAKRCDTYTTQGGPTRCNVDDNARKAIDNAADVLCDADAGCRDAECCQDN